MTGTHSRTESAGSPFWGFSLAFYRRSGVADACIALQEHSGVDVNLLLYLLWQASLERSFVANDVAKLEKDIAPWREATVIPLRALRRALKEPPGLVARAAAEAFRNRIKAVELEAERLQQEAMYERSQPQSAGQPAGSPEQAARTNVAAYQEFLGTPMPLSAVEIVIDNFAAMNAGG